MQLQQNLIASGGDAPQHGEIEANLLPVDVRRRQLLHLLLHPLQVVCDELRNGVTIETLPFASQYVSRLGDVGVRPYGIIESVREHVADVGLDQRRCQVALNKAGSKSLNIITAAAATAHSQHGPSSFVHSQVARAPSSPNCSSARVRRADSRVREFGSAMLVPGVVGPTMEHVSSLIRG